jgi:hypothetical protein
MIGYGRASETERVLVGNDSLINLNWLKIQSNPLGKLSGDIMAKNYVGNGRARLFQLRPYIVWFYLYFYLN